MRAEAFAQPTFRIRDGKLEVRGGWTKREELWVRIFTTLLGSLPPAEARYLKGDALLMLCKSATLATDIGLSYYNGKESETESRIAELEASVAALQNRKVID